MGKQEGKKLTKITPETRPPQAPPKEGMCLAGYRMLCVREMEGEGLKLKVHGLNSKDLRFRVQRICFVAFNLFTYQSPGSSVCGL